MMETIYVVYTPSVTLFSYTVEEADADFEDLKSVHCESVILAAVEVPLAANHTATLDLVNLLVKHNLTSIIKTYTKEKKKKVVTVELTLDEDLNCEDYLDRKLPSGTWKILPEPVMDEIIAVRYIRSTGLSVCRYPYKSRKPVDLGDWVFVNNTFAKVVATRAKIFSNEKPLTDVELTAKNYINRMATAEELTRLI